MTEPDNQISIKSHGSMKEGPENMKRRNGRKLTYVTSTIWESTTKKLKDQGIWTSEHDGI